MREIWARRIAMLTGGLVVVLALVFAWHQNPVRQVPAASAPQPVVSDQPPAAPALIEEGRSLYVDLACARCHSVGGRGNTSRPLDGIGARIGDEEMRAWVTPGAAGREGYHARHARIKLTRTQREALVAYLRSL